MTEVLKGGDVSCDGEILFETGLARMWRVPSPDGTGTVLFKEPLGPDTAQRLQHERRILERLRDVQGAPQLAAGDFPPGIIAVSDPQAIPLVLHLCEGRLETLRLLDIAVQIAQILAAVHRAGVAHKSLSLHSVLWCP